MRQVTFLIFLSVVLVLDVLAHRYLYIRLFRDPGWSDTVRRIGLAVCVALAIMLPVGMFVGRAAPRAIGQPMAQVAFIWMGTLFYFLLALFMVDLFRVLSVAMGHLWALFQGAEGPTIPERRALLTQATAGAAGTAALGVSGLAVRAGTAEVEVRDQEVKLARLPPQLSGLTIAQMSDIHIGPTLGGRFMQNLVDKTNALKPDCIVITGDLVDGSVAQLGPHTAPLAKLAARYGVYFVTGNHEYYSGAVEWEAELRRLGIQVLRNERVSIGDEGASIDLAGIDDYSAHSMGVGHGSDVKAIMQDRDLERELVLLAHQPRSIPFAEQVGAGLQLSGHTHGGQLWPFNALVRLAQPYVAGLYTHDETTQIYVSRGTGYWGPPMRLMAPSEITRIVLT